MLRQEKQLNIPSQSLHKQGFLINEIQKSVTK